MNDKILGLNKFVFWFILGCEIWILSFLWAAKLGIVSWEFEGWAISIKVFTITAVMNPFAGSLFLTMLGVTTATVSNIYLQNKKDALKMKNMALIQSTSVRITSTAMRQKNAARRAYRRAQLCHYRKKSSWPNTGRP